MTAFKLYDIRGVYPSELNEGLAYKIGRATVLFLKCKRLVVGIDCRLSSPKLFKAFVKGVTDQGCDVVNIGLCSTPMLYFASFKENAVMITASHNPKQYNGLKICRKGAIALNYKTGLKQIESLVNKNKFPNVLKKGMVLKKHVLNDYVGFVNKFKKKISRLKIVVDAANGMAGYVVPHLLKSLPIKIIPMYFELDGSFPNHEPNPLYSENTITLQKKVIQEKADLGIAYDGDCDRVFFIDEKGQKLSAEFSLLLFAEHFVKKNQSVVYSNNCSKIVPEVLEKIKAKPIISSVGHSMVKDAMKKNNTVLGGELSGHFYFKQNHFADSGDIAVILMLNILSSSKKPLSQIVSKYKKYFTSEEIEIKVKDRDKTMKIVEEYYKKNAKKISHFYGLTIDLGDWWFILRESQTEIVVKLIVEAKSKEMLEFGINKLRKLIK